MTHKKQKLDEPSYVLVRAKGDMLYDNHKGYFKYKDKDDIHNIVKLGSKEALSAAITTAKALAQETAKPLWYRVINYLEDKYRIKYG